MSLKEWYHIAWSAIFYMSASATNGPAALPALKFRIGFVFSSTSLMFQSGMSPSMFPSTVFSYV